MAGYNRIKEIVNESYTEGRNCYTTFRRVSAIASAAGFWVDLSMATGNPAPNYYVGAEKECTVPSDWYKKGIWTGGAVSPSNKYLHKICMLGTAAAVAPATFTLCDYLMYYPLIDMDSTDEQLLFNYHPVDYPLLPTLPRYTDGVGVKAFLVATNPFVGGASVQISYTNTNDVSGRVSRIQITNTSTFIGTIVNSTTDGTSGNYQAFIPLKEGDLGIKSVQSVTFYTPNGGLACLVLVKPIATIATREATAWVEIDFIKDKPNMPRIYDGAFLNFICNSSATIASVPVIGEMHFIWTNN